MTKYDTEGAFAKLGEDPFLPPAPVAPKRRMSGWAIAGLIIAGLFVLGTISNALEDSPSASSATEVTEDGGLTPTMLVDSLDPGLVVEFCTAYESIDPSMARVLWDQAYADEFAGDPSVPSSSALWYEMTSRC